MGALDGVRVLDCGLLVQGPQAALMLAEFGADVIKVELPNVGDQARWIPVSFTDPRPPYFHGCNRGKRSFTVDFRTPGGADVFRKLADTADVIISNFKPGTMDAWGLGYDVLTATNPGLVYATGSAFGPIGPDAEREGADMAGQAAGGLISTTGVDGGEPTPVGVTIADHIASQNMCNGILAALFARHRTGRGQRVDVSLYGGQIYAQASEYTAFLMTGEQRRANRGHPLLPAIYGIFPTADGYLAMVGVPPQLRQNFYEAIGHPEFAEDPRFQPLLLTPDERREVFAVLETVFPNDTTANWVAKLRAAGSRVAPVNGYKDVVADPQVLINNYIVEVEQPGGAMAKVVGNPIRMSDTPPVVSAVAPELGQDTELIMLDLGYSWDDIEALKAAGSI